MAEPRPLAGSRAGLWGAGQGWARLGPGAGATALSPEQELKGRLVRVLAPGERVACNFRSVSVTQVSRLLCCPSLLEPAKVIQCQSDKITF